MPKTSFGGRLLLAIELSLPKTKSKRHCFQSAVYSQQGPVNEDVLQNEPALALFAGRTVWLLTAIPKDAKKVFVYPGLIA